MPSSAADRHHSRQRLAVRQSIFAASDPRGEHPIRQPLLPIFQVLVWSAVLLMSTFPVDTDAQLTFSLPGRWGSGRKRSSGTVGGRGGVDERSSSIQYVVDDDGSPLVVAEDSVGRQRNAETMDKRMKRMNGEAADDMVGHREGLGVEAGHFRQRDQRVNNGRQLGTSKSGSGNIRPPSMEQEKAGRRPWQTGGKLTTGERNMTALIRLYETLQVSWGSKTAAYNLGPTK